MIKMKRMHEQQVEKMKKELEQKEKLAIMMDELKLQLQEIAVKEKSKVRGRNVPHMHVSMANYIIILFRKFLHKLD